VTNAGRWIHGLLLGGVVVMIRVGNPAHPEGTYPALLLAGIFASLNDSVVVWAHTRRRRARG
jgi:Na+-transporting NADH:ubiquinone oxidoreductase subunit B